MTVCEISVVVIWIIQSKVMAQSSCVVVFGTPSIKQQQWELHVSGVILFLPM